MTLITGGREETVVGSLPGTDLGDTLEVEGEWTEHAVYGRQMRASSFTVCLPDDAEAIRRYLASGAIKGIREKLAAVIVDKFGDDTFRIMEEEPERLAEVKGMSLKRAREIGLQMREKRETRDALVFVQRYGVSNAMALRIVTFYGDAVYKVLRENPYRLAEDIEGIGFRTADEIAMKAGMAATSEFRVRGGILYALIDATTEGHTYLPLEALAGRVKELLHSGEDLSEVVGEQLRDLQMELKVTVKGDRVYTAALYREERECARMLFEIAGGVAGPSTGSGTAVGAEDKVREIEERSGVVLDKMQRAAVCAAVSGGLTVITGGPGTGKTTTIKTILGCCADAGREVLCAAPTGRAAKRMQEATGYEAKTIHRLLEVNGQPENVEGKRGTVIFERNESNPLEADAVIIDETSMVDIRLFHSLLKAIVPGTHLVLVGDANQLPSVGPGQVLRDIIEAGVFPVIVLQKIFRQANESDIIVNAHKVHRGEEIELTTRGKDFFFLERSDAAHICRHLTMLIRDKLPGYVHASPYEIQVLTPMKKGALGAEALNDVLQSELNPPREGVSEAQFGERVFRVGDKVMQVKNNYQTEWEVPGRYGIPAETGTGVFNGDLGVIRRIDNRSQYLTVEFDEGRQADYPFSQAEELQLAYAVTIHKSQGSEYPAVLIPLLGGPRMLFNRNLLYTALTRAKSLVILLGRREVVYGMIENDEQLKRYTGLADEIRGVTV